MIKSIAIVRKKLEDSGLLWVEIIIIVKTGWFFDSWLKYKMNNKDLFTFNDES